MIQTVTGSLQPDLNARLHRVAVDFILPRGLRVDEAVAAAEELVASGSTGEATVDVAALRRDAIRSDAEPLVRNMLAEHGIDVPTPAHEEDEYNLLLRAFAFWDLPMSDFYSPFLHRLPGWDEQDELARALIRLLEDLDHASDPADKREVERRMRATVRDSFGR